MTKKLAAIPYGRQDLNEDDIAAVVGTLRSDFLTQGPRIEEFEKRFAEYVGATYAVAVSNGTAALHLSCLALGVDSQSRVLTTPITFAASANCVRYCGGEVDFVDIDPRTATICLDKLEQKLDGQDSGCFQGVVAVDFAGEAVDLERLQKIANAHNLWILEDACHAPGGYFLDSRGVKQRCGNGVFAVLSVFSFHPVKHIACGEGGMVTTNDPELYQKLRLLRTHGITKDPALMSRVDGGWYYEMHELGFNYRITDFQCALGISQLEREEERLRRRREIAQRYNEAFRSLPISAQAAGEGHAYHLYVIRTAHRKALFDFLRSRNIFAQVHYIPVHRLPYYERLGHKEGDYPEAEHFYDECLSLPMFPTLSVEDQERVIRAVIEFFGEHLQIAEKSVTRAVDKP